MYNMHRTGQYLPIAIYTVSHMSVYTSNQPASVTK